MTSQEMHARSLGASGAAIIITSVAVAIVGGLFLAEGLLGYFYNTSMFWEGLDHATEIVSGLAVAVVGIVVAAYRWMRR